MYVHYVFLHITLTHYGSHNSTYEDPRIETVGPLTGQWRWPRAQAIALALIYRVCQPLASPRSNNLRCATYHFSWSVS